MNAIKNRLDLLESKLQTLIEGGAARLFPGGIFPGDLAYQLAEAMRDGIENAPDGETLVPNLFILHMHPEQSQMVSASPTALAGLTQLIVQAGLEAGLVFRTQPLLRIYPDPHISLGLVQVRTQDPTGNVTQTAALEVANSAPDNLLHDGSQVSGATLVVNGTRIFDLSGAVINIGRQNDNHLVIDDRRVSRKHAQLRLLRGRYMIFDLDSAGGTWVNGQRVYQRMLSSGDMISLAGVPLVYRQEQVRQERSETQDLGGANSR